MDAITLLKEDHRSVEKLFKRFEAAGDKAYTEKRTVVDGIIAALAQHAAIEEQLFYPVTRATVPTVEDIALESLEEHHIVKWVLSELDGMDPRDERFTAKVTVLIENVRHHVEEEEGDYFPKVRKELGRTALSDLGEAMEKAKAVAPTHPHPRSPDTPPGNLVVGTAAGMVDRVRDAAGDLAEEGRSAVQDVIAKVTGSKRSRGAGKSGRSASAKAKAKPAARKATSAAKQAKPAVRKATKQGASQAREATGTAKKTAKRATRA